MKTGAKTRRPGGKPKMTMKQYEASAADKSADRKALAKINAGRTRKP